MANAGTLARKPVLILITLVLIELTGAYETAMIYAALPRLIEVFGDAQKVAWLVTGYMLSSAYFAVMAGRLGDMIGRVKVLFVVMIIMIVGSIISALGRDLFTIVMGRVLQGCAGAILPLAFGIAREFLPKQTLNISVGFIAGTSVLGAGIGLLVGGLIIDNLAWRWIFRVSAAMGMATLLVAWLIFPIERDRQLAWRELDWLGGGLFLPALVGLLLVITQGARWGVGLASSVAIGSLILLFIWYRWESRHPQPLIDVQLLTKRQIAIANLALALTAISALQITQLFTTLMQQPVWTGVGFGLAAAAVGLIKLPTAAVGFLAGLASGAISTRWSSKAAAFLFSLMLALGWLLMALDHHDMIVVIIGLTIILFALAGFYAAISNLVIEAVPLSRTSEAAGLAAVIRTVCIGVGSQAMVMLLSVSSVARPGGGPRYPSDLAYIITFGFIAGTMVVVTLLTLMLSSRPTRYHGEMSAAGA